MTSLMLQRGANKVFHFRNIPGVHRFSTERGASGAGSFCAFTPAVHAIHSQMDRLNRTKVSNRWRPGTAWQADLVRLLPSPIASMSHSVSYI